MELITVRPSELLYFVARVPCGESWTGMRRTDDVGIVMERAIVHVKVCERCGTSDELRDPMTIPMVKRWTEGVPSIPMRARVCECDDDECGGTCAGSRPACDWAEATSYGDLARGVRVYIGHDGTRREEAIES